ncbi:hypothetical protein [Companilactobacillus muriivasis]|uniref:hypothetical protein n=1 Tax=Companilactobacillus muriivasis TaxID=3081444 RepID=UPI0030C7608A
MADLTREAIEKIQEMADQSVGDKRIIQVHGENYQVDNFGKVNLIIPETNSREEARLSTLSGLVEPLKNMRERSTNKLFVQVVSPKHVEVFGALDKYGHRKELVDVEAMIPEFSFDECYEVETLNIALQARFVQTPDRDLILKVIGNLREEQVHSATDDGVNQSVKVKEGVASVAEVKVPNTVAMKPYRTFVEVDQPISNFVFRMQTGMQAALFEADGGAWKNEAMNNIKKYLLDNLDDEIQSGHVTVIV